MSPGAPLAFMLLVSLAPPAVAAVEVPSTLPLPDPLTLEQARVPDAVVAGVRIGQSVMTSVAGEIHVGRLQRVGREPVAGKPGAGSVREISIAFRASERRLHAGQPATVEIP